MDIKKATANYMRSLVNNPMLLFGGLVLLLVVCFVFSFIGAFTLTNPCENTKIMEVNSPDNKLIACAFIRNCGATTDYSTQVTIRGYGVPFDPAKDYSVLVVRGKHDDIKLSWNSPDNLVVDGADMYSGQIYYQAIVSGGIAIQYK